MTGILPGRYVPSSGTLHKDPATERCNLDDTNEDTKITTLADVQALGDEPRLCHNCFDEKERMVVEQRWPELVDEATREVYKPGDEVEPDAD
jgi:hypothetical protein